MAQHEPATQNEMSRGQPHISCPAPCEPFPGLESPTGTFSASMQRRHGSRHRCEMWQPDEGDAAPRRTKVTPLPYTTTPPRLRRGADTCCRYSGVDLLARGTTGAARAARAATADVGRALAKPTASAGLSMLLRVATAVNIRYPEPACGAWLFVTRPRHPTTSITANSSHVSPLSDKRSQT